MGQGELRLLDRVVSSRLFVMTSLPALDGTLFTLGATGGLGTLGGATIAGLTCIAGASAWLAVRDEFGRLKSAGDRLALFAIAAASTLLALGAVAAGAALGSHLTLAYLRVATAAALLVLAAQTAGVRIPRVGPLPPATFALAAGLVVEVFAWTL